jgi:DNA polymerase III alpha subunit
MYLAQDIAGWDLHKADGLRKMTKAKGKYPEKVKKLREDFIADGQSKKGLEEDLVTKIWDDVVAGFGGYGFNIPHAVLYSMISFHTAYLKANFPLEFLVANLMSEVRSNQKQAKDNIMRIKDEIRAAGVKIVPPNINTSDMTYKIVDDKTLMTGLDALKYMGKDAIPELVAKRPFKDFKDMMYRVSAGKVRAPTIQALAVSGALDEFKIARKKMFLYASDYRAKLRAHMDRLDKEYERQHKKYPSMPKKPSEEVKQAHLAEFDYPFPKEREWNVRELFALEEYYMGEGITGSVFERYNGFLRRNVFKFDDLPRMMPYEKVSDNERDDRKGNSHNIASKGLRGLKGIITSMFVFKVKKEDSKIFGQEMARIQVQDPWGGDLSVIAFPNAWEKMQQRIHVELSGGKHHPSPGLAIFFRGVFQWENAHTYSFILDDILDYKPSPSLPEDLKSRKVKMPRVKKLSKKDIDDLEKNEIAEALEEEMIEAGVAPVEDIDDIDRAPDPFGEMI